MHGHMYQNGMFVHNVDIGTLSMWALYGARHWHMWPHWMHGHMYQNEIFAVSVCLVVGVLGQQECWVAVYVTSSPGKFGPWWPMCVLLW
jgi:hypothetical protein